MFNNYSASLSFQRNKPALSKAGHTQISDQIRLLSNGYRCLFMTQKSTTDANQRQISMERLICHIGFFGLLGAVIGKSFMQKKKKIGIPSIKAWTRPQIKAEIY